MTETIQTLERTRRQVQDYIDVQAAAIGHKWCVVRRGRPGARVRVLASYAIGDRAAARFSRERIRMRQGILALVNPDGQIVDYASEPMVRSRW